METGLEKPALNNLPDSELVGLAAEGDPAAFDCLVLRHRESILQAARATLGDWDLAEDAAQQALLEAFRGLGGLREGEKFRPWVMTIARRCALHAIRSEPQMVEFSEAVMQPLVEVYVPDGLADSVRASLHELSSRSRRVITLHYLDGYSCREIGNQLSIPEGTVKRILHESRNSLRARMGAAVPRTGGHQMSTKTGPRHLVFWVNGHWPGPYVRDKLTESVCLAVNKTAKTPQEIGKIIDANAEFVKEAAHPLVLEELMVRADDRLLTSFIALDADDWLSLTKDARVRGKELADRLKSYLPELEEAWGKSTLPGRGFPWEVGIWPMLAIFVCNHGVARNSAAPPMPEAPVHPDSGRRYSAGGREFIPDEDLLWTVGLSSYPLYPEFSYAYFWSFGLARNEIGYSPDWAALLYAIDLGIGEIDLIAEKACQPVDKVKDHIARLIESGAIRRVDGKLTLTFPVIRREDSDTIVPTVDRVSSELSSEILAPATADVADKLRAKGYGHLESQFGEWRRWSEGYICGEALKELMNRGVLPNPGSPAPANFCLVGWKGQLPLKTWKP